MISYPAIYGSVSSTYTPPRPSSIASCRGEVSWGEEEEAEAEQPGGQRRTTMARLPRDGRRPVAISPVLNNTRRRLAKREAGLFKEASDMSLLCGAHVAVVVVSEAGDEVSAMGSPSVDHVLRRFAPLPGEEEGAAAAVEEDREVVVATMRRVEETRALVAAEEARMRAVGDKVLQAAAGRRHWWEADVEALGEEELPEFERALQQLRANLLRRTEELRSARPPPQA